MLSYFVISKAVKVSKCCIDILVSDESNSNKMEIKLFETTLVNCEFQLSMVWCTLAQLPFSIAKQLKCRIQ